MTRRMRPRLTYANVMSTLAVFLVLGGVGYAANKIGTKDIKNKAVTTAKIDKKAIKANRIQRDAVKTNKLKDEAVTLQKLDSTSVGEGFQPRGDLIYASVSGGVLVDENSRGAVSATNTGTGQYTVTFDRDVTGCAWFPSRSAIGTAIPANGDFLGVGGETGEPNNVRVRVRDQNNNLANRSFSLLVVC